MQEFQFLLVAFLAGFALLFLYNKYFKKSKSKEGNCGKDCGC